MNLKTVLLILLGLLLATNPKLVIEEIFSLFSTINEAVATSQLHPVLLFSALLLSIYVIISFVIKVTE